MARRYSRGAWKLLEKKKEREEGCKKGGKGKRSRLTEIREKECTMSRIEGVPPCTLRVLSSERKDGGERHERKNWKLINGVSWHIRRRVKKKKKKRRRNTVEIWMLEGKRNFFFFFLRKKNPLLYTLSFSSSSYLSSSPFALSRLLFASANSRLPWEEGGKETHFSSETWRKMKRVGQKREEVGEGRRRNPSLFAGRSRIGRKSARRGDSRKRDEIKAVLAEREVR